MAKALVSRINGQPVRISVYAGEETSPDLHGAAWFSFNGSGHIFADELPVGIPTVVHAALFALSYQERTNPMPTEGFTLAGDISA